MANEVKQSNFYTDLVFGIKTGIFDCLASIIMSQEILEVSVLVEEKFDMSFNLANGLLGFILRIIGK